jgi:hypothetical protein
LSQSKVNRRGIRPSEFRGNGISQGLPNHVGPLAEAPRQRGNALSALAGPQDRRERSTWLRAPARGQPPSGRL